MERVAWYQTWFITASLEVKQEDILGFWLIFLHLIISLLEKKTERFPYRNVEEYLSADIRSILRVQRSIQKPNILF